MDKIKALLGKAGVNGELASRIVGSLESYKTTLREQFEQEYAGKVEQAKRVCIEETETHKRELARRLQIFCETKGAAIEAQLAKSSALNESEALSKLTAVRALLEGITLNGEPNGAVTAGLEKSKKQVKVAVEQRDRAVETANRQTAIAEKALKKNRVLATENAQLKKRRSGKPVTEGKQKKSRRIDGTRKGARQPVSTRPTLVESQDRRPPKQKKNPHVSGTGNGQGNGYGISDIASQVDEDLV
jgi:hypothetical protein